jgi:hypothetical protein
LETSKRGEEEKKHNENDDEDDRDKKGEQDRMSFDEDG